MNSALESCINEYSLKVYTFNTEIVYNATFGLQFHICAE